MLLSLRLLLSSCRQRPLCGQPRPNCLPRWCSSRRYWQRSPRRLWAEPGVRVRCRQRALRFSRNVSSRLWRSVGRDASSAGSPCPCSGLAVWAEIAGIVWVVPGPTVRVRLSRAKPAGIPAVGCWAAGDGTVGSDAARSGCAAASMCSAACAVSADSAFSAASGGQSVCGYAFRVGLRHRRRAFRGAPHRHGGEYEEREEGRDELLSGDVEFHDRGAVVGQK